MANLGLEKYVVEARAKGMSDDVIRQDLLKAGWNSADIGDLFNTVPTPLVPIKNTAFYSKSAVNDRDILTKKHHYLGPIIVFFLCLAFFASAGFLAKVAISKELVIGGIIISIVVTAIFSLIAFVIRKIGKKFGKKYAILSWIFVFLAPIGIFGFIFWRQNQPSPSVLAFQQKVFYQPPSADWKTYINEPFDLSLKYSPTMKLIESPSAYGFDDVFGVHLEQSFSSTTGIGLSIYATTDSKKCTELVATRASFGLPPDAYKYKKNINGKEFLVGNASMLVANGSAMQVFGYLQRSPICKVASAVYMVPLDLDTNALNPSSGSDLFSIRSTLNNATKDTLAKIDYTEILQTAESIIGSMSLDIKDTGSADTTRMNESESALNDKKSDAMTRISGARGAAFRVYNYNSDNTPKTTRSYIGTCEDKAFKSINPDMICRESADAFIMYFKINDEFGYACGNATSYGMVNVEPKGFFCGGSVSASPAPIIKKGTSVNGAYSHIGVSNTATISNCGILKYKDNTEQSGGIGASDCFNQAIKSCQPAVISGVVDGFISTYQVVGKESAKCVLTQRFFKQVSSVETQSAFQKCMIDPTVGWPSLSGCVEEQ